VSQILRRIARVPRLELTDEQARVARAKNGDRDSVELLIASNLPFVIHIAKGFRGRGVPFEDLIAEGCVGLLKAIRRYSAANGTRFMTYASFWVRKEILAAVVEQPHPIHVPRYARERGRETIRVLQLDGPVQPDGSRSVAERLRHPGPQPAEAVIHGQQKVHLRRHVLELAPRDRAIIAWRYGLCDSPPQTLGEIGRRLGLSRERVRQIEAGALARLRALIHPRVTSPRVNEGRRGI
jgi:RNA polymerase primary sigma factor